MPPLSSPIVALLILLPSLVLAQSDDQRGARKIVSDDFTRNRQQTTGPAKPQRSKITYRPTSAAGSTTKPQSQTNTTAQLGITIWRLRPTAASDTGARMLVRENNKAAEWIPVRVEADTIFHDGDQIRLSIESPRPGYLYVIDRDLFSNGSTGPAMLIYPWANMRGGDNRVGPGKLIDIPDQDDTPNYFTARRSSGNQSGEILTIIVTSSPLDLPISDKPLQISNADLTSWEKAWGGFSERFEMEGGAGQAWTHVEQQAAHSGGRQLTREDPAPQTIYRVSVANNKALLLNVRLEYGK
jgi:hypothetical protein